MRSVTTTTATAKSEPLLKPLIRIVADSTDFMLGGQILIKIFAFMLGVWVVRRLGDAQSRRYSSAVAYIQQETC